MGTTRRLIQVDPGRLIVAWRASPAASMSDDRYHGLPIDVCGQCQPGLRLASGSTADAPLGSLQLESLLLRALVWMPLDSASTSTMWWSV